MYGYQQHLINESPNVMAVLEYICSEANKLTNCGIYYCRQMLFKAGKFLTRGELDKELKSNIHFKAMRSACAQQTLHSVVEPNGNVLGIDPGLNNWITGVSNTGKSFIIDGKRIKSQNQWYNKQVANIKTEKPQGYWNDELAAITEKHNRQMRDNINKAARFIINWCLTNNVSNVVFGWNPFNKDGILFQNNIVSIVSAWGTAFALAFPEGVGFLAMFQPSKRARF